MQIRISLFIVLFLHLLKMMLCSEGPEETENQLPFVIWWRRQGSQQKTLFTLYFF